MVTVHGKKVHCPHCTGELHACRDSRDFVGEKGRRSEIVECGSLSWFTTIIIRCWKCSMEICKTGAMSDGSLPKEGWTRITVGY